jgi:hypothetical protein
MSRKSFYFSALMRFLGVGISTAKVVILFVVGLLLAVLVFPVAFFVSAALGYVFGVIALAIGV